MNKSTVDSIATVLISCVNKSTGDSIATVLIFLNLFILDFIETDKRVRDN